VLEIIAPAGNVVVSGFPWQIETPKQVGIASLKANILCNRHNSDLSPLDDLAKTFFARLRDVAAEFHSKRPAGPAAILLNGHALERWALKVLCGAAFSGNTSIQGVRTEDWVPPDRWLRHLFPGDALEPPQGLYFAGELGEVVSSDPQFSFATIGSAATLLGAVVRFSGFRFILSVDPMPVDHPGSELESANHRVFSMRFTGGPEERFIIFGWPKDPRADHERNREITTNWIPPAGTSGGLPLAGR
jgi:hypothetical protein